MTHQLSWVFQNPPHRQRAMVLFNQQLWEKAVHTSPMIAQLAGAIEYTDCFSAEG